MTTVITDNTVKERETYLPLAKAFAADAAQNDKGCHEMEVLVDPEREDHIIFISKWDSKDDFLAHVQGPTFAKHIPGMGKYYISGTDTFLENV